MHQFSCSPVFVKVEYIGLFVMEGSVVLTCEVYGTKLDSLFLEHVKDSYTAHIRFNTEYVC